MKEMVDLVGIEPTTFPAGRDALRKFSVCNYVKQRTRRKWWTWSGSNRRPLPCHGSALPAAPQAHKADSFYSRRLGRNRQTKGDKTRPTDLVLIFPLNGTNHLILRLVYRNRLDF